MEAPHHDAESHDAQIHDAQIIDQFTRQADPFVQRHGYRNDPILDLMTDCAAVNASHEVLDVACGPGIVSCFFARRAHHVTGLDFVPAMLDRARLYQAEQQVSNVTWQLGSSSDLPFADGTFHRVVTRFSFHHFLEPGKALAEMKRVCLPGGIVLVCDVAPSPQTQAAFNHWEILRDPSHTRALTVAEMEALGKHSDLDLLRAEHTHLDKGLDDLLSGSFPRPGDDDRIRALFDADIRAGTNTLGVAARQESGTVRLTYPVVVLAWRKPL